MDSTTIEHLFSSECIKGIDFHHIESAIAYGKNTIPNEKYKGLNAMNLFIKGDLARFNHLLNSHDNMEINLSGSELNNYEFIELKNKMINLSNCKLWMVKFIEAENLTIIMNNSAINRCHFEDSNITIISDKLTIHNSNFIHTDLSQSRFNHLSIIHSNLDKTLLPQQVKNSKLEFSTLCQTKTPDSMKNKLNKYKEVILCTQ